MTGTPFDGLRVTGFNGGCPSITYARVNSCPIAQSPNCHPTLVAVDQAMKIEVALYATLSKYLPAGAQNRKAVIEVKDGATVREVMNHLGIPSDFPNILLVNGRQAPDGSVLKDGETLSIFPPMAGGSPAPGRPLGPTGACSDLSSVPGEHLQPPPPSGTPGPAALLKEKPCPSGWV